MSSSVFPLIRLWLISSLCISLFPTFISTNPPSTPQSQLPANTTLDPGLQLYLDILQSSLQQSPSSLSSANATKTQDPDPPAEVSTKYTPPVSASSSKTSAPPARRLASAGPAPVYTACSLPQSFAMSTSHILRTIKSFIYIYIYIYIFVCDPIQVWRVCQSWIQTDLNS